MEVELIAHTPEPDIIASVAAMLTHSKSNFDELKKEVAIIKRSEYKENIITRQIYIVLIQKFKRQDFVSLLLNLAKEQLEYIRQSNTHVYYI